MPRLEVSVPGTSRAMLCPSCRKLIDRDEPHCPYCGTLRPGLWGMAPALQRWLAVDIVRAIVGACIVLYAIGLLLDLRGALAARGLLNLLSPSTPALYRLGMTGGLATLEGHWWTPLTAVYLHGGLLHIFFNMMWIRQLGVEAVELFGRARFFVLFTATGVAGFLLSNALGARPSIGASGAIFGLLGAMLAFARRRRGGWGDVASRQILQWAVILLVFGFITPGVNNLAHLGGLASGFLLGRVLPSGRREGRGVQLLAVALVVATLLAFLASVVLPLGRHVMYLD
jgi:rhomboid protease GluP